MLRSAPMLSGGIGRRTLARSGRSSGAGDEYSSRNDLPSGINPAGTTWKTLLSNDFDGPVGSAPPAPWHSGCEWETPHSVLGGRQQNFRLDGGVILDAMATLDGSGNLKLQAEWDAPNSITKLGYLITGQDGSTPRPADVYFSPTSDGLWFECRVKFSANFADPLWFAFWLYDVDGPSGSTNRAPEIDIVEYKGEDAYRDRFMANTHGPTLPYVSSIGEDGGYGIGWGGYFKPVVDFPGAAPPNDGEFHVFGLFWSLTEQRFYYDGILIGTRPVISGDLIHDAAYPMDLRLTLEVGTNVMGSTGTPAAAAGRGEFTDCYVLVDYVRVLERKSELGSSSVKSRISDRAAAMGLQFLTQDLLGETGEPIDPWDYFTPVKGGRNSNDTFNSNPTYDKRVAITSLNHAPPGVTTPIKVLQIKRTNGYRGSLNFLSNYLPGRYNKYLLSAWVYYDANFASCINTAGGYDNLDGKTPFLIHGGHPRLLNPAETDTRYSWSGATTGVEHSWGFEFGLNFVVRTSNLTRIEYVPYGHLIGFNDHWRADCYSNYWKVVGGVPSSANVIDRCYISLGAWHLMEMYLEVGNTRTSGKMYFWVDGTLSLRLEGMDLGGWFGDRGFYTGITEDFYGSVNGALDANYATRVPGALINSAEWGGWRIGGDAIRDMDGGATASTKYINRATSNIYLWNRCAYGSV